MEGFCNFFWCIFVAFDRNFDVCVINCPSITVLPSIPMISYVLEQYINTSIIYVSKFFFITIK